MSKEQTSLRREAEAAMRKMDVLATFGEGYEKSTKRDTSTGKKHGKS